MARLQRVGRSASRALRTEDVEVVVTIGFVVVVDVGVKVDIVTAIVVIVDVDIDRLHARHLLRRISIDIDKLHARHLLRRISIDIATASRKSPLPSVAATGTAHGGQLEWDTGNRHAILSQARQ